jgi:hypothetical protein
VHACGVTRRSQGNTKLLQRTAPAPAAALQQPAVAAAATVTALCTTTMLGAMIGAY